MTEIKREYVEPDFDGCLVALAILFVGIPFTIIVRTFVLVKVWSWYAVEDLGFQPLSMLTAYGLSLVFTLMRDVSLSSKKERDETLTSRGLRSVLIPPAVMMCLLGFAWVGRWFV